MASKPDPPTQASMAKSLNVSQQVLLRKDRWRKFITTDEAWIYLSVKNAKSKVQYLSCDQNKRVTTVPHPKGVMVSMGISANGVTKPRFLQPGAKINSEYYIHKILKPFPKDDYCRLYPNGGIRFLPHRMHLGSPRNSSRISKCNSRGYNNGYQTVLTLHHVTISYGDIWKTK
ncbi:hypothetical protein AVEN_173333-1 [Araneus ventricosus]|uniref:Uncharacterized protein n=1 Tax=Araneus ventricosus TaxID=182803 RepID=A0A4Y2D6T3_ARAVE|nr:hypothetical protein AVEN_108730-1 [Araneus ventricosus]GBM12391.1 hypothetical protein AVEN_173333-1 [Araneus ventricosus]